MERAKPKEGMYRTFIVRCETHGTLGYVYSAATGMHLFEGHREMMNEDCGGVVIEPHDVPLDPEIYKPKYIGSKPPQKFIPP